MFRSMGIKYEYFVDILNQDGHVKRVTLAIADRDKVVNFDALKREALKHARQCRNRHGLKCVIQVATVEIFDRWYNFERVIDDWSAKTLDEFEVA